MSWILISYQVYDLEIFTRCSAVCLFLSDVTKSASHSGVSDSLRPRGLYSPWNSPEYYWVIKYKDSELQKYVSH